MTHHATVITPGLLLRKGSKVYRVTVAGGGAQTGIRRHPAGQRTWWIQTHRLTGGEFRCVLTPSVPEKT